MDERVNQKITVSRGRYIEHVADQFDADMDTVLSVADSPIELIFGAALIYALKEQIPEFMFNVVYSSDMPDGAGYFVVPQHGIGSFIVDFFIRADAGPGKRPLAIAIECDGHDFHERTKQQARRDRQRDRLLQMSGIVVMRFTGSEIWEDADKCARQVTDLITSRIFFD